MATTKRKPPAKRRTTSRAAKKGNRSWLGFVWAFLIGLALVVGWIFLSPDEEPSGDFTQAWVESVLIAADVNLKKDRQIINQDGTERWKIDVSSRKQKALVLRALEAGVKSRHAELDLDEELSREGRSYQVAELSKENGDPLRLIFEMPLAKPRTAAKPTKSTNPKPASASPQVRPTSVSQTVQIPPVTDAEAEIVSEPALPPAPTASEGSEVRPSSSAPSKGLIAIILDDIGQDGVERLRPVLDLKFPITFAILPYLGKSKANAYYLHQSHYELLLHMPMEPESYPRDNPGKGAILTSLNEVQIRSAVEAALDDVPFVSGVNNHMGSRITAREEMMLPILDVIKKRDLFFVDSRTQNNTVGFKLAKGLGMQTGLRDVFLDTQQTYAFVVKQLEEARRIADRKGSAIVIGHPYPTTLHALAEVMPTLDKAGYRFVFASELVHTYTEHL